VRRLVQACAIEITVGDWWYVVGLDLDERGGSLRQARETRESNYRDTVLMPLEILDIPLMLFGRCTRAEGAKIPSLAGFGVLFPGIETIPAGG
jgi:hypothetical protein